MENIYYSLKDFELSLKKNAIKRADDFQQYINQLNEFGCKAIDNFPDRSRVNNDH